MGALLWTVLADNRPSFNFLKHATAVATTEEKMTGDRGYIYTLQGDATEVLRSAKQELGMTLERIDPRLGVGAKVLTVPEIVDGRVKVASRPLREVLVIPGFAWTDGKGVLHLPVGQKHGTTVEVREYHGKTLLDGVRSWVRRSLNV